MPPAVNGHATMHSDPVAWVTAALEQFETRLTRYAERLTGNAHSARDVVQHAFLKLCDQRVADVDDVRAWLFTVCHHRAMDLRRSSGRAEPLADADAVLDPAHDTDPAEQLEAKDLHQKLQSLVDELPDSQRDVVHLWSEGFEYCEISGITGHTENYIRVLMHRGLHALRRNPLVLKLVSPTSERTV